MCGSYNGRPENNLGRRRTIVSASRLFPAVGAALVNAVYPPRCARCGRRGRWVCAHCDGALTRFAPPWCDRCGVPCADGACRCSETTSALTGVRSVAFFDGWLRDAIHAFKYQDEWARSQHLGATLVGVVQSLGGVDALVPVPLHPSRLRRRGYNQSALLAKEVSRSLGLPVLNALTRNGQTRPQVGLGAEARQSNVLDAFVATGERLDDMRVALIDDVVTTGATLGECARVLSACGPLDVVAATLARER